MDTERADRASIGKTRRFLLKLMGAGGLLGAAGAAGIASSADAAPPREAGPTAVPSVAPLAYPASGAMTILAVTDAGQAVQFYQQAFGSVPLLEARDAGGQTAYAELRIAGTQVGLTNANPQLGIVAPSPDGAAVCVAVFVADLEQAVGRAATAGATVVKPPTTVSPFLRHSQLEDPFGHHLELYQRTRDFTADELRTMIEAELATLPA